MHLMRAAEILIDKIRIDYREDVAVVVMMGSHLYGETHSRSDLDMYFVVNTPRGYELSQTFIIDGIGFDYWPISWERLERIAAHDERITAIITEGQILYSSSEEDLERFNELKAKALDVSDGKRFIEKAKNVLDRAYKPCYLLDAATDLTTTRKMGIQVTFAVTNALALLNRDTVKRGRGKLKGELLAMPHIPKDFAQHYDVLFESEDMDALKTALRALLQETARLVQEISDDYCRRNPIPVSDRLPGFYEELINFYNKIAHGLECGDLVTVFYVANEICIELEDVFSGTGVSLSELPDIVGAFPTNPDGLLAYGALVQQHQSSLVALLEKHGIPIKTYVDFEELAEAVLRIGKSHA